MSRLLFLDPGFSSLRLATRGTISMLLTFFTLSFLAKHFSQPPTLAFLGVMIALLGSMVVNDAGRKQQMISMVLMIFPALAGLGLSISLHPFPILQMIAFLGVTFLSVYIRRFGPRWFGGGFVAFMAFCAPLFFPIPLDAVPWVLGSVVISLGLTFLIRFFLLPDRSSKIFKNHIKSFERQTELLMESVVQTCERVAAGEAFSAEIQRKTFRRSVIRLNELTLLIEQLLNGGDFHGTRAQAARWQMFFFEKEISLRQVIYTFLQLQPALNGSQKNELSLALRSLQQGKEPAQVSFEAGRDFVELFTQMRRLQKTTFDETAFSETDKEETSPPPQRRMFASSGMRVTTRQAIQATVATAIASVLGQMISSQRWYWASIAAFVIFAGASRGETALRAASRTIGTILGLGLGFALSLLFKDHHSLEWALVLVCVFLGLFGARMAFGFWSATLFTTMLAVLYDAMGQLSAQILVLRFEETLLGVLIGAVVAALILPVSTRSTIRTSLAHLFLTLADIVGSLPAPRDHFSSRRETVSRLNQLDRELQALRTSAAPISGRLSISKSGDLLSLLFDVTALSYLVRHLATYKGPPTELSPHEQKEVCRALQADFLVNGEGLKSQGDFQFQKSFAFQRKAESELGLLFSRIDQVLQLLTTRKI